MEIAAANLYEKKNVMVVIVTIVFEIQLLILKQEDSYEKLKKLKRMKELTVFPRKSTLSDLVKTIN